MNKNLSQTDKALKMARIRLRKNIGYSHTSGNVTHKEALRIRDLIREYIRIYNGPEYFQVVCECNKMKKCRNHDFLKKLENILIFIEANTVDVKL